jgi:hypothetical protein
MTRTLAGSPRLDRTIAPFGDFARTVKHMRFPAQTREGPHFPASTRAIVKHLRYLIPMQANTIMRDLERLFPRGDDGPSCASRAGAVGINTQFGKLRVIQGRD